MLKDAQSDLSGTNQRDFEASRLLGAFGYTVNRMASSPERAVIRLMLRPPLPCPGFTSDASSACQLYNSTNNTRELHASLDCLAHRGLNKTMAPSGHRITWPPTSARQSGTAALYIHTLLASSKPLFLPHHTIRVANPPQESQDFL